MIVFREAFYANLFSSVIFIAFTALFSVVLLLWRRRRLRLAQGEIRQMSPGTCVHCPLCHKSIVLDLGTGGHGVRHLIGRELCVECSKLCQPKGDPS